MPSPLENMRDRAAQNLADTLAQRDKLNVLRSTSAGDPLQFEQFKLELADNWQEVLRLHADLTRFNERLGLETPPLPPEEDPQSEPAQQLTFVDFGDLVEHLLACPCLSSQGSRAEVISQLPPALRNSIRFTARASAREEVAAILQTCLDLPQGVTQLLTVVRFYDTDTTALAALERRLIELNLM